MSNRLTSIFPANPSDTAMHLVSVLIGALVATIHTRSRSELVELLGVISNKLVDSAESGMLSLIQFTNFLAVMNSVARAVAREAVLRGYLVQEEIAPSKTGLKDVIDDAIDSGDMERTAAAFVQQFNLVADRINRGLGDDLGVTRKSLADAVRDISKTGDERDIGMADLVESMNPVWDRAIEAGFITEDDVQDSVALFTDDREGGFKWLAHMADVVQGDAAATVSADSAVVAA